MNLATKRWPAERFASIAERLVAELGAQVLLTGGPGDTPLAEKVEAAISCRVVNLVGRTGLGELGAILERCDLFLGNDTGAMHLAVAVGTPVVAIFGPTSPANYGPYGSGAGVALWRPVECSPCLRRGRANAQCPRPRCIEAITVEEVWQALKASLPSSSS